MNQKARFVQIHFLTSYPAVLLNRDDAGFAKRIRFGGVNRTRISSQCQKRHWRTFEGQHSLGEIEAPPSIRSRHSFDKFVYQPLVAEGVSPFLAKHVTEAMMFSVLGQSAKSKKEKEEKDGPEKTSVQTKQLTVFGKPELDFIRQEALSFSQQPELSEFANFPENWKDGLSAKEIKAKEDAISTIIYGEKDEKGKSKGKGKDEGLLSKVYGKKGGLNLKTMTGNASAGLGAALFGRMVTSDMLARCDASIHVAHAFTVHEESPESDYFSAVDDLLIGTDDETMGSAHIGSVELDSGIFYGFVVVDIEQLISNLMGSPNAEPDLAASVVHNLIHLVATVSPGAKLGSTAPYSHATMVMVETGKQQPRTLANAFICPVSQGDQPFENTYRGLAKFLKEADVLCDFQGERRIFALQLDDELFQNMNAGEQKLSLSQLAAWAEEQVRG